MELLADLRVAARGLMRSKGFAFTSAITLALGIAATTTIFSIVYGVLLRLLKEGATLAIAGIGLGLAGSYWAAKLLAAFLYGVSATDLTAFAGAAAALFAVAMLATYLPARKAARVDPMHALRAE
jgi:hypothetical protein